jgi:hypothetical protein
VGTPIRIGDRPAGWPGPGIAITPDGRTLFAAGTSLIPVSTATGKPELDQPVSGFSM